MSASVADLCKKHELTVEELTRRTGLDSGRVLAIILGSWTHSPEEREKIAAVFDVTIDQISWGHKIPIQHIYGHGPG